jgi:hypothetical protein
LSHDFPDEIISLPNRTDNTTVTELLARAKEICGNDAVLELGRDVLEKLVCPKCKDEEEKFTSLGKVNYSMGICPKCGEHREVQTFYTIQEGVSFADKTFAQIGVPKFDIVWARSREKFIGFEFTGDAPDILGPLYVPNEI